MKKTKYTLKVLSGQNYSVDEIADYFSTNTAGYYAFFRDKKLVSCYPIKSTVIETIVEIEIETE